MLPSLLSGLKLNSPSILGALALGSLRGSQPFSWPCPALPSTMFSAQAWEHLPAVTCRREQGGRCWADKQKKGNWFSFLLILWKSCNHSKGAKEAWDVVLLVSGRVSSLIACSHYRRLQACVHFHTCLHFQLKLDPILYHDTNHCHLLYAEHFLFIISFSLYNHLCSTDSHFHHTGAEIVVQRVKEGTWDQWPVCIEAKMQIQFCLTPKSILLSGILYSY